MIGQSAQFKDLQNKLSKVSEYQVPVLIQGETGTGKELAARYIHYSGIRKKAPFVPVNCGAIPDLLFENELFGHRRGAFTDARDDYQGLVALANTGTLFLDEIDALSQYAQVALLRFLQDQQYRPLGCECERNADIRIITATNADLESLSQQGKFRSDLLYRLKILHVDVPPLRERKGDPAYLASHFIQTKAIDFNKPQKPIHPDTLDWMGQYNWPGNIRELENLICREFLMLKNDEEYIRYQPNSMHTERRKTPDRRLEISTKPVNYTEAKNLALQEFELRFLTNILRSCGGNVTRAAQLAQVERRYLGKMIKKYNLDKSVFQSSLD